MSQNTAVFLTEDKKVHIKFRRQVQSFDWWKRGFVFRTHSVSRDFQLNSIQSGILNHIQIFIFILTECQYFCLYPSCCVNIWEMGFEFIASHALLLQTAVTLQRADGRLQYDVAFSTSRTKSLHRPGWDLRWPGQRVAERTKQMKNLNATIGNRTRNLPVFSAVLMCRQLGIIFMS